MRKKGKFLPNKENLSNHKSERKNMVAKFKILVTINISLAFAKQVCLANKEYIGCHR